MAKKLASLFIELAANGDKLTAELKKTKKGTQTWSKDIKKATDVVTTGFKTVAVGVGIAATSFTALYVANARQLDQLGKTAAKLGDTTENLKAFGLAAEFSGVGAEQANTALQRMTRRLAEAAQGTGEARNAVAELGLDAAELSRQRPSEAFEEIAEALATIPNQADRVRLAMKFFDSEGVALVNVTTAAIDDANRTLEAFGGALTTLEVSQIEAANDSITRLSTGFDLLGDKFTAKVAPAVTAVANQLFESAQQTTQLDAVMDRFVVGTIEGVASLASGISSVIKFIDGREEIAAYGLVGYMIYGKKGFALGVAIGSVTDILVSSAKSLTTFFDDSATAVEKTTAEVERLEAKIAFRENPAFSWIYTEEGTANLEARLEQQRELLTSQQAFGASSIAALEEQTSLATIAANGLDGISETLLKVAGDFGNLPSRTVLQPPTTPNITVPGDDQGDDVKKGNDAILTEQERFQKQWTKFNEVGAAGRLSIMRNETRSALTILADGSKTLFNLNKAFGLADATVSIATGISKALSLPFPASLAAAAKVALEGAAQIKTITSAKYGEGKVTTPGNETSPTNDVSSANSGLAANDPTLNDSLGSSTQPGIVFFGFHTPGATDEQKADEQARLLALAQENDLITTDSAGQFTYNGSGTSNYEPLLFETA